MTDFFKLERDDVVISPCGRYRYALHRKLDDFDRKACMFLMLNPSTADGRQDDPTIRRCIGFAKAWECSRLYVANLFAWRATDPDELKRNGTGGGDIVGPDNQGWVEAIADVVTSRWDTPGPIVCAWGPKGVYMRQNDTVTGWLEETYRLQCLGFSNGGFPRHPLMMPKAAKLEPFKPTSRAGQ